MKTVKLIYTALLIIAATGIVKAQAVDNVLNSYLDVKNALVAGDAALAASKAKVLIAEIAEVKADGAQQAVWKAYAAKLSADSKRISEETKLDKQRQYFAALSSNIYQVAKATKPGQTLYVQYCPMKKASWLSSKKEIENPYYGAEMLSCGGVKETLAAGK